MPLVLPTVDEYERMAARHKQMAYRRLAMESATWRQLNLDEHPTIAQARTILDTIPRDPDYMIWSRQDWLQRGMP